LFGGSPRELYGSAVSMAGCNAPRSVRSLAKRWEKMIEPSKFK